MRQSAVVHGPEARPLGDFRESLAARGVRAAPKPAAVRSPLLAPPWEIVALLLLPAFYLGSGALVEHFNINALSIAGSLWLTAILGLSATRAVLIDANAIWTALFWFRISAAVYFGLGAIVPLLANSANRIYMETFYVFRDEEIAKLNAVSAVGIVSVLIGAQMWLSFAKPRRRKRGLAARPSPDGSMKLLIGLLFLLTGGTVKYLFAVPHMFGIIDYTLPGSVGAIGDFTYAALFFLTIWSREHARSFFPLVLVFFGLELLISVLAFTKGEILTVLILFLLALVKRRITLMRMGLIAMAVVACYLTVIPIVNAGRAELVRRYGELGGAGFSERLDILDIAINDSGTAIRTNVQPSLVRISYVNQATFAINQYDSGIPGDSFKNLFAVFVPRFFWPDKPIITQGALDFNNAATGNPNSASSPGLFAEAYWNFGWSGVVLLMLPLGMLYAFLSRYTMSVLQNEMWLYFPVVLMGMRIGMRVDGYYVVDVVGASVIALALFLALSLVDRALQTITRRPAFPRPLRT